jgi:hypothetical protein
MNRNLLEKHEYHVVPNAGHFAFLICGPSIKAVPEFCKDGPGFDRQCDESHRAQLGPGYVDLLLAKRPTGQWNRHVVLLLGSIRRSCPPALRFHSV